MGEGRPCAGQKPQLRWPLALLPCLSQQLPGRQVQLTKVTSMAQGQASPWSVGTVAQLLGSRPTPYLGMHGGHSHELHVEHTLVAIHPAHARQRHLWEGHTGGRWLATPH